MIESYQTEVARKRKAARIFWFLVFFFATFLYFFFQGYYPDVRLGLKRILSESGTTSTGNTDLIKSFGIINISVKSPIDASISLGTGSFSNDEKRMTNYGEYSATIERFGYITDRVDFVIDKKTPYYIANINLLQFPTYTRIHTGSETVTRVRDQLWLRTTESGSILQDEGFSGGTIFTQTGLTHISEGYALSGGTLFEYNNESSLWEEKIWSGSTAFVRKCGGTPLVQKGFLSCPERDMLLTEKGKTLTGVIDITSSYVRLEKSLLTIDTLTPIILTGSEIWSPRFIEEGGNWYSQSGSVFSPLGSNKKKGLSPIETGLDSIGYASWVGNELVIIGKTEGKKYLVTLETSTHKKKMVEFPDIELLDVRIEKYDGNFFIKSRDALLLLYNDSKKVEWLIDGRILAFSRYGALYVKDGATWQALWGEE